MKYAIISPVLLLSAVICILAKKRWQLTCYANSNKFKK